MKTKDFLNDIKKFSVEELQEKRRTISEELMKLRFKQAVGQLNQGHTIPALKKHLARVNTKLSEKKQG